LLERFHAVVQGNVQELGVHRLLLLELIKEVVGVKDRVVAVLVKLRQEIKELVEVNERVRVGEARTIELVHVGKARKLGRGRGKREGLEGQIALRNVLRDGKKAEEERVADEVEVGEVG
jgi:hypothetical protein